MPARGRTLLLVLVSACSFPPPPDVPENPGGPPDDAQPGGPSDASPDAPPDSPSPDAPPDAPDLPGTVLQVSPTGDDANDGLNQPVRTLKRALGLAAANNQITRIVLAGGRYSPANGETFPYTIPANVTIAGPAGGGAILVGTRTEPGMTIATGAIQDVELEDFTFAITATGTALVKNVRIRTTTAPVRAETAAKLTIDNLDITGIIGACGTGIVLNGAADLSATTLATRNLATTLEARDQSTINIAGANIAGDPACESSTVNRSVIWIKTNKTFTLSDSLIDGGVNGVSIDTASSQVTINHSTLRNMRVTALNGGDSIVRITGGELSQNGRAGLEAGRGSYSFTDVTMKDNGAFAIFFFGERSTQTGRLTMRNCVVTGPKDAISLYDFAILDLGTAASPGGNTFQSTQGVALFMDGGGAPPVDAIGNTWRAVQGANLSGRYANVTIQMPVARVSGNNYAITGDWRLNL